MGAEPDGPTVCSRQVDRLARLVAGGEVDRRWAGTRKAMAVNTTRPTAMANSTPSTAILVERGILRPPWPPPGFVAIPGLGDH